MPSSVKYSVNNTQGNEIELPCLKCSGRTVHKALVSAEIRGSDSDHHHSFEWSVDHQIVQCLGCKTHSYRVASTNSEDYYQVSDDEYEYEVTEKLYPPRLEGIKGLGDETHYLPAKVRQIYEETLQALAVQSPVLAGIGVRALLETVCKERAAVGSDLFKKIDSLVEQRVLTPASAAILHKIRALGNAAAHEVKPHSDRQLALAMDIVEHLLKDVYILPKQADSEFNDKN
jgi:hypothetical protein